MATFKTKTKPVKLLAITFQDGYDFGRKGFKVNPKIATKSTAYWAGMRLGYERYKKDKLEKLVMGDQQ